MAINKKLITFASKSTFTGANGINGKTSPTNGCYGNIPSTSIVFILDTGEIWTHGKYISGGVWGTKQDNYVPLKIAGTEYNLSLNGHKQSYTTLTGSTTTANQAIVSNGTANGWTLKTLGSRAFDSTSYLPVAGGALSGDVYFKFTATNSDTYPTGTFPKLIWSGSSDSIQLFANVATDNNMLLHINHDDDGDEGTIMTWAGVTKITFAKTYIQAPTFKNSNGTEVSYAGHTHTTGLAADTGTAAITLKHGSTYKLSTGGTSVIFKMPTDNNTTYNFSGTTFYSGNSNTAEHDANNAVKNGHYYYQSNGPATSIGASTDDGALYVQSYSDSWVGQIAQDYRNGRLFFRGKNNGTWQPWLTNIDSGNYTNYAATKDHTHSLYLTAHQDISGKVNKSGDTMAGLLTLANGLNKGIKFANGTTIQTAGTSDGGPVMLSGYLRFSTGSSWDYSAWAGLGYDTTNKIIYLGIPGDGTVFLKNSAVNTGGTLLLVNVSSLKLDGNKGNSYTVYHSGNLSSLKNPNSLTIQTNGTSLGSYDGSAAKTWNITYSNVGAAAASHTHNYLPLSGGTIDSTSFAPVTIYRNGSTNAAAIAFKNSNGTLNYFGATLTINGQFRRWLGNNTNTSYEILDSSTTNISNGVIKINGTTITPLTSHQSLADYYNKSEITTLLSDTKYAASQAWYILCGGASSTSITTWYKLSTITSSKSDNIWNDWLIEIFSYSDQNYTSHIHGYLRCTSYGTSSTSIVLSTDPYATINGFNLYSTIDSSRNIWLGVLASFTCRTCFRILQKSSVNPVITSNWESTTTAPNTTYIIRNGSLKNYNGQVKKLNLNNVYVDSAATLTNTRTLWGQSFDGTSNVSGNMTGVGSINTKSSPASTIYTNNWFRSVGASGWYSESYGGGWYMKDSTWIRNFGTKAVYLDANLCSGAKIGIGTTSPSYLLDVAGKARITGPLLINGGESNYCEGIRIASNSNGWTTIILKGSDNTSDSGTSTSSWSIHNYNGWYYINKNGSSDLKATRLWGHDNGWTIGNTSTTSYPLNVGGDIYSSGYARAASGFVKTNGTAAQVLRADGGVASFNWSGLGGQPTWLWGGNSQHTYYVYNPSNFSVKYATSAGNADTLDSKHWSNIKIGGRNYFKQSSGCSGITKDSSINGGYASVAAGNQIRIQNFGSDGIDSDWTVSFYIKASNATTCDIDMCDIGPNSSYNESNSMSVTTSYVKHTFTFLNVCQYHTSSSYNGFIDIYSSAAATIYLKDIKIERGTIATDWSLAPEDAANIHNHTWASITDKIVAGNEFNIVNSGYNSTMWFNYLPCDDRNKTAAVSLYIMGNGNKGYASVKASTYYNSSGTEVSYSGHTHTFASLTNKPTTLAGYGITDAASSGHNHDGRYLGLSGGTMSGAVYSTFTSNTWINGVSNAVINLNNSGYGAAISMPVNSGRVSISTYAASTNNVYFGYASSTQIANGTNSFTTQMYWDAPNNILYANTFSGALSGNASSATKLTTDAGGSTTPVYFSGGKPVACTAYSSASVNYANSANKATYVVDYASTDNTIKIGYKTASLTASEVGYVCVFASDISNGVRIKDIGQSEFLKWLALPFSSLTSVPTTLTGYGITDGVNAVTTIGDISASISGHTLTIKYSGSSTPTQGVYILANGSLTNYSSWNTANNSKAVAVALVAETNTIFIALVDHETTEPWMESYGYTVCSGQYTTAATVRTDNNGYGNSTCISSEDTNGTSAAYIADNDDELYLSSGLTSRGFIGAGYEWYLIYQNITAINAALTKCGGTALSDVYYWTSTEYNGNYAWAMNPKTNVWTYAIKSNNYKARSFYE